VRAGFFDKDVLSSLAGPYSDKSVPMVRSSCGDGVDVLVLEDAAKVILGVGREILVIGDLLNTFGEEPLIDVTERLNADVGNLSKVSGEAAAASSDTNDSHIDALIGTDGAAFWSIRDLRPRTGSQS